jgi:hypothetical protein
MTMNTSIIWLAGLLDGEGCLYARFTNAGRYKSNPIGNLETRVTVQAASERMIAAIQEVYVAHGIDFFREKPKFQLLSTRLVHKIDVSRKVSVEKLLRLVVEHLKVKDREARAILAFYEIFPSDRTDKVSTQEDRQNLVVMLRDMKKIA